MFGLGATELIIILVIVLIIFGAGKLPQIGDALGRSIKNFKKGIKDGDDEPVDEEDAKPVRRIASSTDDDDAPRPKRLKKKVVTIEVTRKGRQGLQAAHADLHFAQRPVVTQRHGVDGHGLQPGQHGGDRVAGKQQRQLRIQRRAARVQLRHRVLGRQHIGTGPGQLKAGHLKLVQPLAFQRAAIGAAAGQGQGAVVEQQAQPGEQARGPLHIGGGVWDQCHGGFAVRQWESQAPCRPRIEMAHTFCEGWPPRLCVSPILGLAS